MLVDGYVRVSQVAGRSGESFISPSVQREQIEAWVALHGAVLGEVFVELDESGARRDRPMLMEAIERAERGQTQGVVVAKLDRFGRSLVDGLANIERLSAAGAIFVSVQDGLDLSTPTGKLVVRIMLSMAEWELDRIRANWDVARIRALDRGVYIGGWVPFGYRRGIDGRLQAHPTAAPLVARAFALSAAGASHLEVADFLTVSGLRTSKGSSDFTPATVARMLRNRVYLGEVKMRDRVNPNAHPALVDTATWERARRPTHFRNQTRSTLLGGILRCGSCRMKMGRVHGGRSPNKPRSVYQCPVRTSAGRCPGRARIQAEEIEGLFEELVFRAARRSPDVRLAARVLKAEKALARAEEALLAYRDDSSARSALGSERFGAGLLKRAAEVQRRALVLSGARAAAEPAVDISPDIEARWPDMDLAARRETIERFVDCAFVMPGKAPGADRVRVCMRGDEPSDVPTRGRPLGRIVAFDPAAAKTAALPRLAPYSERRIQHELLAWGGERTEWPRYEEFLRDGRARLFLQVLDWGGPVYWAHRLGWQLDVSQRHYWDRGRIRGALRPYLKGRESFPSRPEFEAVGAGVVREAAHRHGGIGYWAGEFGVTHRKHPGRPRKQKSATKALTPPRRSQAAQDDRPSRLGGPKGRGHSDK